MLRERIQLRFIVLVSICIGLSIFLAEKNANPAAPPSIKFTSKPAKAEPDHRARTQPTIPENYREMPFTETAPQPKLMATEKQRGYMLFQRPIVEPVYPNTQPLAHERLNGLTAFGAAGEFEPVTFSVYPIRNLENFRIQVSALSSPGGMIDASQITARLVTYWNVGYPRYTSRDTYRRTPELLEDVTVHSSPAGECQRWWIRIHIPDDAKPGLYRGKVTVWDDGFEKAVEIPLALRVLGFKLKSDPNKHYSSYYYVRNSVQYKGKDEEFIKKATGNEYRSMVEYGLDMLPTFSLQTDQQNQKIIVRNEKELERMLAAGMKGPLPVTGGGVMSRIYQETTPDGKRENHWKISKMPPPQFYEKVTALFKSFQADCRARGWPEVICCPIDEVASSHKEFGWRVYQAVHQSGVRTYATKNPIAADAEPYRPYIDIWCSQPYSMPYDKIIAQNRYEYWCYPNHNAGEIKDRRVMCKGGRMTYGFGFWKSGYTTLIPWNWNWTPAPDQFDYLRGSRSGCGQRIGDDGQVIPAVYWECFREGRDDARYIYTLQQAVCERDGSNDANLRRLVESGKALLQETWDAIEVQQKYLADGMWPSEEFNARRWRLARMIESLLKYPATNDAVAPSVLISQSLPAHSSNVPSILDQAMQQDLLEAKDLGGDFTKWRNDTKEGMAQVTTSAGLNGAKGLRWRVKVDHNSDGGEGGKYPVGWPRLHRDFNKDALDMSSYDYLEFKVRVDSNRDEVADDSTPLNFLIGSHQKQRQFFSTMRDLGDRQRVWIPIRFSVQDMIKSTGMGAAPWKTISKVQLNISERDYKHGADLTFDVGSVKLLRFTSPMISRLEAPRFMMLPRSTIPISFDVLGLSSVQTGSHRIKASLIDEQGKIKSHAEKGLSANRMIILDASKITPGRYTINVEIITREGKRCSEMTGTFEALGGPLLYD